MTDSTALQPESVYSYDSSALRVLYSSSPRVEVSWHTSRSFTHGLRRAFASESFVPLPAGTRIEDWELKSVLVTRVRRSRRREYVALTWLEAADAHGVGVSVQEALEDLVVALGEYCESLQEREARLDDAASSDLARLRELIHRTSDSAR